MSKAPVNPPSYEAAVSTDITEAYHENWTRSQSIRSRLTTTRTQHITNTVTEHILPLIEQNTTKGVSSTSIALIPIDVTDLSSPMQTGSGVTSEDAVQEYEGPQICKIVSVQHEDDNIQHVQLSNSEDSATFWSQLSALEELQMVLETQLGSFVAPDHRGLSPVLQPVPRTTQTKQNESRGFSFRKSSKGSDRTSTVSTNSPSVAVEHSRQEKVIANVTLEEICLRTQSVFGLYGN